MVEKKKHMLFASIIGIFSVALAVVVAKSHTWSIQKTFANDEPYILSTGTCTEAEVNAREFVRYTDKGNPITFKLTGNHSYDKYSISKINATSSSNPSATIYNETPIRGLTQMTFSAATSTYYKCFYGSDLDNLEYATEIIKDRISENITIDFEGINIQYFKLVRVNLNGSYDASFLKPITLKYECENEVSRGESFANGTELYLSESFPNDGTFAFDYKATSGTSLRLCFMQSDWSKYFGYLSLSADGTQIYGTTQREHRFGVRTSPLSDGYVHVTVDFSTFGMTNNVENRNNVPTTVDKIYISGCDSEGFIDLLPTTHSLEGLLVNHTVTTSGSIQSIHLPFAVEYKANMEVIIDMNYDDPTQKLSIAFGSYNGRYDYKNLVGGDNRFGYVGAYIVHISNTHHQFIFDLDDYIDHINGTLDVLNKLFIHSGSLATGTLNFYINL